ncbi:Mur ligase family protein [Patescibacteria group bacterium]
MKLFRAVQPIYHYCLTLLAAIIYRFPSRKIKVIAVTGTKGKTSTIELINAILEEAGYTTALSSTLRFKVGEQTERNLYKMTMPGRFFMQWFLRRAVREKCDYAIVEMTSEGAKLFRNKFIAIDTLIFTNITPEHIESHGSYEKYLDAKLSIARSLQSSKKKHRTIIANKDDKEADKFLNIKVEEKHTYSLSDAKPYALKKDTLTMHLCGKEVTSHLSGIFNVYNILAASTLAKTQDVRDETIIRAIEKFSGIRGRMEHVNEGQDFTAVVDYAHTPESLEKVYETFGQSKLICVLGGTGGGRDTEKRQVMGGIASKHCSHIILTNEDPYDEDPEKIVLDIAEGINRPIHETVMNRREAIAKALSMADTGDSVVITGKGTDPYIMGPNGSKEKWDDAEVVREELKKVISKSI